MADIFSSDSVIISCEHQDDIHGGLGTRLYFNHRKNSPFTSEGDVFEAKRRALIFLAVVLTVVQD